MSSRKRAYTNQQAVASAGQAFKAPRSYAYQGGVVASSSSAPLARVGGRNVLRNMPAGAELKDLTTNNSGKITAGTAANVLTLLNGCAQGTTASTRLGRRILMKSLLIRWHFAINTTTAGNDSIRVLIIYDSQTNGTAPAATDVLLTDEFGSPMNLSNSRRFKVLIDELVPCIGTAGPGSACGTRYVKGEWPVEFNTGSAGTVGDIQSGSIYMLTSQGGKLITAAPAGDVYARIRYSD